MRSVFMRSLLTWGLVGAGLVLAGCNGRLANPEPVDWPYDRYYSCTDIRAEKVRIRQAAQDRGVEEYLLRQEDNDLMARTIPFLAPGNFAIQETRTSSSAKTPQQVEIDALLERNKHLDAMAADRGC